MLKVINERFGTERAGRFRKERLLVNLSRDIEIADI